MPLTITTLGHLRALTKDLPDDTVLVYMEGVHEFYEVTPSMRYFPPSLDAPGALIIECGQEITEDHHLVPRLDVWHEYGEYLK